MRRRVATAAAVVLLAAGGATARAEDTWWSPFPGVRKLYRTTSAPNRIHAMVVDLCHPGIRIQATTSSQRGRTTSSLANLVGSHAAVNGDWSSPVQNYKPSGLAIGNGARWADSADNNWEGFIAFGPAMADIVPVSRVVSSPPDWMNQVVGGRFQILLGGVVGTEFNCDAGGGPCVRNPRSAVGMSEDRRTLYLAVIDGRSSLSIGLTAREVGALMKGLGAYDAMMLDGGGSSTMFLRGKGVVNRPSDGAERVVANHIAVFAAGTGDAVHCIPDGAPTSDAGPADAADAAPAVTEDGGAPGAGGDTEGGCRIAGHRPAATGLWLLVALGAIRSRSTRRGRRVRSSQRSTSLPPPGGFVHSSIIAIRRRSMDARWESPARVARSGT